MQCLAGSRTHRGGKFNFAAGSEHSARRSGRGEKGVPGLKSRAGSVAPCLAQWAYSFHYPAVFYCFIDQLTVRLHM